jgi:hypothetical protein
MNQAHHAAELFALLCELPPPARGQRVVPGAPVVLGCAPLRLDPSVEQQALQRGVERTLANVKEVTGREAEVFDDAVPMPGAADQCLENELVERAW